MMKEAQAMMQDPNFQANMKKMMGGQGFQDSMAKTNTDLQDPVKLKAMEEKAEAAIAEGNKTLEERDRLRRLQVTAAVEKAKKEREEAAAAEDDDKKQAAVVEVADVEEKGDGVPAFQGLNLN
jgi:hypothetical protein